MSPRVDFSTVGIAAAVSSAAFLAAFLAAAASFLASSSKILLCERMIRLASLLNSITLKLSFSLTCA